jgi:electron transfer flavoprotein alpha subunit
MRILIALKPRGRNASGYGKKLVQPHGRASEALMARLSTFVTTFSKGACSRRSVEAVIAVSVGSEECEEGLTEALEMGCHSAIHVKTDQSLQPLAIAKVIRAVANRERADLIVCGDARARKEIQGHVTLFLAGMTESPLHAISDSMVAIESNDTNCERVLERGAGAIGGRHLHVVKLGDLGVDVAPRHRYWPPADDENPIPSKESWFLQAEQDQRFSARGVKTSTLVVLDHEVLMRRQAKDLLLAASRSIDCPTDVLVCGDQSSRALQDLDESFFRTVKYVVAKHTRNDDFDFLRQVFLTVERGYSHVFLSDTWRGEHLAIQTAAHLGVAPVLNVLTVHKENAFSCLAGGRGGRRTVETCDSLVVATICERAVPNAVASALVWDWRKRSAGVHQVSTSKTGYRHGRRY